MYQLFELKMYPTGGLLGLKTMPKHFINNYETIQKTTFLTPYMVHNDTSE